MTVNSSKTVLVDTGFWIALLDERDEHFEAAQTKAALLLEYRYILPWPILYETLRTRLVRNELRLKKFERFLKRPNANFLEDGKYREKALEVTLSKPKGSCLSLDDSLLREIIDDRAVRIHYLFTFNVRDFADVCRARNVEIF